MGNKFKQNHGNPTPLDCHLESGSLKGLVRFPGYRKKMTQVSIFDIPHYHTELSFSEYIKRIVDLDNNDQISRLNNLVINSLVEYTLTNDCCLRCGSFDQIAELVSNANARKSASSGSEIADFAFSRKSSYSEDLEKSIDSSTSFCLISNCRSESFDLDKHSDLYLFNSFFTNSGAINLHLIDANKYADTDEGFIIENKELLSNTSLILDYLYSSLSHENFYGFRGPENPPEKFSRISGDIEFSNSSLLLGETSLSNCLNLPFFLTYYVGKNILM